MAAPRRHSAAHETRFAFVTEYGAVRYSAVRYSCICSWWWRWWSAFVCTSVFRSWRFGFVPFGFICCIIGFGGCRRGTVGEVGECLFIVCPYGAALLHCSSALFKPSSFSFNTPFQVHKIFCDPIMSSPFPSLLISSLPHLTLPESSSLPPFRPFARISPLFQPFFASPALPTAHLRRCTSHTLYRSLAVRQRQAGGRQQRLASSRICFCDVFRLPCGCLFGASEPRWWLVGAARPGVLLFHPLAYLRIWRILPQGEASQRHNRIRLPRVVGRGSWVDRVVMCTSLPEMTSAVAEAGRQQTRWPYEKNRHQRQS